MAERDPFGRLPDENPLAALGWVSDSSDSQGTAQPVADRWQAFEQGAADAPAAAERPTAPRAAAERAAAQRAAAERAAGADRPRPRARVAAPGEPGPAMPGLDQLTAAGLEPVHVVAVVRRVLRIARIVVSVVVALIVVLVALGIAVGDDKPTTRESAPRAIPAKPAPPPASAQRSSRPPTGLQPRSLLTRGNVSRAMRRLATSGLGRLRSLRIAAERIDVQLLTREGRLRSVQVTAGGGRRTISLSGTGFGALPTLRFADIDAGAPARMARGAAGRTRRPVSRVDYVAYANAGPQAVWTVVMRGGGQFIGDARGHITRRVG
jgi:hypothetical protein